MVDCFIHEKLTYLGNHLFFKLTNFGPLVIIIDVWRINLIIKIFDLIIPIN